VTLETPLAGNSSAQGVRQAAPTCARASAPAGLLSARTVTVAAVPLSMEVSRLGIEKLEHPASAAPNASNANNLIIVTVRRIEFPPWMRAKHTNVAASAQPNLVCQRFNLAAGFRSECTHARADHNAKNVFMANFRNF
jgi:hypothetical protein